MPLPKENAAFRTTDLNNMKAKAVGVHKRTEGKRIAERSFDDAPNKKRPVLGEITNNVQKIVDRQNNKRLEKNIDKLEKVEISVPEPRKSKRLSDKQAKSASESMEVSYASAKESFTSSSDESRYLTPVAEMKELSVRVDENEVPEGVEDFDKEMINDTFSAPTYAQAIFRHFKERELIFRVEKYMDFHTEVSKNMRAILVDWMAEVQESFELNHETLYLAVKMVDMYLSKVYIVPKANLQLLASTSLLIAAKFDERVAPSIEDFVYICDEAYSHTQIIRMEIQLLKTLNFDLGIPISYTFLRRYARCSKQTMEMLTLARYILELSLMEYDLIDELDSRMAAACLTLALRISKSEPWNKTLEYYTGYTLDDLSDLVPKLNNLVKKAPKDEIKTIYAKYSHKIFFEVALKPALTDL